MPRNRRKKHLVRPRLQLLYTLVFLGTAGLYVLLQAALLDWHVLRVAATVPPGAEHVLDTLREGLRINLLITFAVLVPLTTSLGILVTHRVAGPLHRFERFLRDVAEGRQPPDCRLRRSDELQDLCALLNEATRPLREPHEAPRRAPRVDAVPAAHPAARPASRPAGQAEASSR